MRRLIAPALLLLVLPANANGDASIEVTISGIRSGQGEVVVDICPQQDFLHACPYTAKASAHPGSVTVTVPGVPPGRYAVQAYHDANDNGDLDRGIFGIPREGIGFSNDAMAKLVRPKFTVAAFDHGASPQHLPVTLRYFLS